MRIVLTLFLFCVCMSIKAQQQDMTEMKKAIDLMQGMYDITFVYDSSLVTAKPQAFPSAGNSLKENLERIFGGTGIKWEIRDEYVLLFHPNNYTFSGYVCEDSGETLINVTVLDLNTLKGTLSNEHGFFSITLPEGKHKFRFSYIGYQDVVKEVDLSSNYNGVIYLKESSTALKEVVVVADMNAPLRTTQTGKVSLTSEQLNTEFSLLSSPDLVKTLQNLPGVASGTELLSGHSFEQRKSCLSETGGETVYQHTLSAFQEHHLFCKHVDQGFWSGYSSISCKYGQGSGLSLLCHPYIQWKI